MRRLTLFFFLLMALDCIGQGVSPTRDVEATDDGIIVTYRFNGGFHQDDPLHPGAKFWKIPGFALNDVAGEPSYSFHWDTFVVPDDCEVSLTLIDSAYTDTLFTLAPAYPPILMSDTIGYTPNRVPPITAYSGLFPNSSVLKGNNQNYRGQELARVVTMPVQYNYDSHTVRSFSMIKYKVSFTRNGRQVRGRDYASTTSNISISDHFLENTTLNYSLSSNNRQNLARQNGNRSGNLAQLDNRSYLIITTDDFLDAVNEFADWKRTKGFNVVVISRSQGSWTYTSVKSIVDEAYRNIHNRYLLLVGDCYYIPSCYMSFQQSEHVTAHFPSDFQYSCVNSQYDFTPDILTGRIPVSSNLEAKKIFDKIIKYEQSPTQDESFYNTFTCASIFQDYTSPFLQNGSFNHCDGFEDSRATLTSEEIRNYLLSKNKTGNRIYDLWTLKCNPTGWNNTVYYDGSLLNNELLSPSIWMGDSIKIKNAINDGTFLLSYIGHGYYTKWLTPLFEDHNISSLTNVCKYPVILSMSCNTGRFDFISDCLAELFLKKANGGAVSVFAPSMDTYFGYTEMLDEYCIDAIWPDPGLNVKWFYDEDSVPTPHLPVYEMGEILNQAFSRMSEFSLINTYTNNPPDTLGYMSFYQLTRNIFHLFGDPSMRIYTNTPVKISDPTISFSNNAITVRTTDGDARISFYSKSSPSSVVSYLGDSVDYTLNSDSVIICIDRHNCIPYILELKRCDFIQNETIDDSRFYVNSSTLKIGRNVTTTIPEGDVMMNSAKVIIKGGNVELHPGTTIVNSNVEINPQ